MKKRSVKIAVIISFILLFIPMVVFAGTSYNESEPNDSYKKANTIVVETGNKIIGEFNGEYNEDENEYSSDEDYYKFTLKENAYVKFNISSKDPDIEVAVAEKNFLENTSSSSGICDPYKVFEIGNNGSNNKDYFPKGTYYIIVRNIYSNYYISFQKTIVKTATEPNNIKAKAKAMSKGKVYNGVMSVFNAEDWYKVKIDSEGKYCCSLVNKDNSGSKYNKEITTYIFDNKGKCLKLNDYYNCMVAYEGKREDKELTLKPGTYYINVMQGEFYYSQQPAKYTISLTKTPANVSRVTAAKGNKRGTIKVKWTKTNNITGYKLRYSNKSSMSKAKTITITNPATVSKTIKNLKSKNTYYVQVKAYRTVNGHKCYSKWSSKKKTVAR